MDIYNIMADAQFRPPLYLGNTITASIEAKSVHPDKQISTLSTVYTNQDSVAVLEGEAVVLVSK